MSEPLTISVSSYKSFGACSRKAAFYLKLKKRKRITQDYLALGSAFHVFAAQYYKGDMENITERMLAKFHEEKPHDLPDEQVSKAEELLQSMAASYIMAAAAKDRDEGVVPLSCETNFCIQVSDNLFLVGVIDLVGRAFNRLTVTDHKTSRSARASYFSNAHLDPQAILYPYAARECGIVPEQFCFNVITKTASPYLSREYYPVNWDKVDQAVDWLKQTAEDSWINLPDSLEGILELPGDITECRDCAFMSVCHASKLSHAKDFLKQDYENVDHSRFFNEGGEDD